MPYVQFELAGDFIPEPRCSKFVVGLQTRGSKMGGIRGLVGLRAKGPRVMGAPSALSIRVYALLESFESSQSIVGSSDRSSFWRERIPFYR